MYPTPTTRTRPPDPPIVLAEDHVAYRRRFGTRIILVLGDFDRLTPPEVLAIHQATGPTGDDCLIAAVEIDPTGVAHDIEARMRLAYQVKDIQYVVPYEGDPWELVEALRPDQIIDFRPRT